MSASDEWVAPVPEASQEKDQELVEDDPPASAHATTEVTCFTSLKSSQ